MQVSWQIFFSYCLSENVFSLKHFWMVSFCYLYSYRLIHFYFQHLNILSFSSDIPYFNDEWAIIYIFVPLNMSSFPSLIAFKCLSSSLAFIILTTMCLHVALCLSCLNFTELLGSVSRCTLPNWEKFPPFFLPISRLPCFFSPLLLSLQWHMLHCLIVCVQFTIFLLLLFFKFDKSVALFSSYGLPSLMLF